MDNIQPNSISMYVEELKKFGWTISPANEFYNENDFPDKFKKCPSIVKEFICSIELCANEADNVWWLTPKIYLDIDEESAFKWNEFENMSIESSDGDSGEVIGFWENVFPIMQSVKDGYAYIGVLIEGEGSGKIVMGREPFFEEYDIVSDDFESFLSMHLYALRDDADSIIDCFT